MNYITVAAD